MHEPIASDERAEGPAPLEPVMDAAALDGFLRAEFPQMFRDGDVFVIEAVGPGAARVRFEPTEHHLRPGGTVSGPSLFTLADVGAYIVTLAHVGPVALAVTTSLTINFLHRPRPGPLRCDARILKRGKRLVVTDVAIADARATLVAHATATYSVPPR